MTDEFTGAGLTLLLNENNNYSVLMAESNSDKEYKRHTWLFPGGRRNGTETPHQTAYREFIEEIFNILVPDEVVTEIINIISTTKNMYAPNTVLLNNTSKSTNTFIQSADAITIFVDVLKKHNIKSDVFQAGYEPLYDADKKVNIYQLCAQRKYIRDKPLPEKNELVFITMIPLKNLLDSIRTTPKGKSVYHYHGKNLRLFVPTSILNIEKYLKEDVLTKILAESLKLSN
jgi:hypothetical protein